MKRILSSSLTILGALALVAAGTGAFLGDTERSSGNTFAAGVIDLKVDNDSYYNGNRCVNTGTAEAPVWQWQGTASYPVPGTSCTVSWLTDDLKDGFLFFNFVDLKPDDEGEDTLSLHVGTNDAWACMDVSLTSNDDRSSNEPELLTDAADVPGDTWDGELAQNLEMVWWADDGDNVLEEGEQLISDGAQNALALAGTNGPLSIALADASHNAWGTPGPLVANATHYIGTAWCFGTLTLAPLAQDGLGTNGPAERGGGVVCNGTSLGNQTQTDGATLDVAFRTVQARGMDDFVCTIQKPRFAKLTVVKQVVNDNNGNNVVSDFLLYVDNGTAQTNVTSGQMNDIVPGTYLVDEQGVQGYVRTFSGDCDANGSITLAEGDDKTCTITNDDLPANITLFKVVTNDNGGTAGPTQFGLTIDGTTVSHNTSVAVQPNTAHTVSENGRSGYSFVSMTGTSNYGKTCPSVLGGTITLDEGEAIVCTITNDDNAPAVLLTESFPTVAADIPDWNEDDGTGADTATFAAGTGNNSPSPDGGAFANIDGGAGSNNGWICRSVNATGYTGLKLAYYWRAVVQANNTSDDGIVEYKVGGACGDNVNGSGWTLLQNHDLTANGTWNTQAAFALSAGTSNTTFLLRFRASTNSTSEDFRVDGITITGVPL